MGKRKERRLAAMSNAGRRVKLDLFAEPSGDLTGSSAKDKVDEIGNSEHLDGLPKSPSSSGQQSVNPLLLLGQYSDDETEDRSEKPSHDKPSHDGPDKSFLADNIDKVESPGFCETVEVYPDNDLQKQKVGELEGISSICVDDQHKLAGGDAKEANLTALKEADPGEPSLSASGSEGQVVGDVNLGWKLVMHEESNQFYYWNTETGETSWEAPAVFLQTAQPSAQEFSAPQYSGVESNLDSTYTNSVVQNCSFPVNASFEIKESAGDYFHTQKLVRGGRKCLHCGKDVDNETVDYESGNNSLAETLINQSEHLLERLKSLKSANGALLAEDRIASYMVELEIRHSDLQSLALYSSSLHPFWLHSEVQLRRLELAINDMISKADKYNSSVQVEVSNGDVPTRTRKLECGKETELTQENRVEEVSPSMENGSCENLTGKAVVMAGGGFHEGLNDDVGSDSSSKRSGIGLEEGELIENAEHPKSSSPISQQDGEDIDMDVDMEVEDTVAVGGVVPPPLESLTVATEGFFTAPPLPDDEWIPPPPPETEQIPPPPPDEPPEPSCPPITYPTAGQSFTYTDYSVPYNYTPGGIAGNNFYVHGEGGQFIQPDMSILYGAVPSIYGDAAHISVNSVGPVVYYGLQDGAVPPVDGVMPVESTQVQLLSVPSSNSSLLTENKDSDPPTSLSVISASTFGGEGMAASLGNTVAATVTTTSTATSTDQKKVSRSKKRTTAVVPTLWSNKKVSSLVDKWKAAKDELQEEEEEEDEAKIALTMLEKKRQREIEEWRAQQIASGEAKDNANFQPLGGDWRERVKRKRAQSAGKVVDRKEIESAGNQQPDLAEISRRLPSGWQAYWDESSKRVYYGNTITSETSWTRPT
ncbi:hypothetical protein MLD38_000888 [Melastoma candidum]|uniref:Uncharacterized protein n=1 Tax=Melastoma candidum TaxID=119954 RepID=A0ACB9SDH6_9MYRT|nr:hypothetical protein MLD38_000888 [Melastoma candidum]